jgi:uncharacterized membrane protein YeaQ/YmgE (transglycosylase-associated protein family)
VADDVLAGLKASFLHVAAEEAPIAQGETDKLFRRYTGSTRHQAQLRVQARAILAQASQRALQLGRFAALDAAAYQALGSDRVVARLATPRFSQSLVKQSIGQLATQLAIVPAGLEAPQPIVKVAGAPKPMLNIQVDPGRKFKKMRLFIKRVTCVEESDEVGADEINMGGTMSDAFGNTSAVGEFAVSHDFDRGEHVDFGFSRVFATWDLQQASISFPYVYTAIISMAEKDDGGFYKVLAELLQKVRGIIEQAVTGLVGAAVGSALGSLAGPVGTLAGAVVGAFVGWLITLLNGNHDDHIATRVVTMTLASAKKAYYDWAKLTTPEGFTSRMRFSGDGARYDVDLSYRVFTQ